MSRRKRKCLFNPPELLLFAVSLYTGTNNKGVERNLTKEQLEKRLTVVSIVYKLLGAFYND